MDVIMGGLVVLVGATAIAVVCMALWGTVRALIDGKFVTALLLIGGLVAAGYYGKQGYGWAARSFVATDLTVDLRSGERIVPSEWSTDLRRLSGKRSVQVFTPDGRQIRMLAQTVELRKQDDTITSVWLASDRLISDDAAELAKSIADELGVKVDDLEAWADRRRHAFERDPPGWNAERRGRPYVKLTIDSDGHGYWWTTVYYVK